MQITGESENDEISYTNKSRILDRASTTDTDNNTGGPKTNEGVKDHVLLQQPALSAKVLQFFGDEPKGDKPFFGADVQDFYWRFSYVDNNRKYHVEAQLNSMVRKFVKNSKPDKWLSGKDFAKKLKEAKSHFCTGKEMRPQRQNERATSGQKELPSIQAGVQQEELQEIVVPTPIMAAPFSGGVVVIREAFLKKVILEEAVPFIINSLSEFTLRQYFNTLTKWWDFA
ncbi:hypothetical protein ILUMI_23219 [Ignelater luminosus]|uniref:Uncharacterized protein n=1 Tax=Ignelater luminosus TaxID=2038154 RepID=A0A8K0G1V9_IGNLU|nr:hypothetical protein ILUMI_23219 [Ignelater luminosus]